MMRYFMEREMNVNRYVCSVIDEMRDQLKHLDHHSLDKYKSITAMMLEEVQTLVNRMESALEDWQDYEQMLEKRRELKAAIKKLKKKKTKLLEETGNE